MQEKIVWTAESYFGKILHEWWLLLEEDRASRAMLRRCATLNDVILSPAYQRFYRYMLARNWRADAKPAENDKLAAIAGLLAHIKMNDSQLLSIKMSEMSSDRLLVSEIRFRNLIKMETTEDIFIGLRRVLPLLSHQANIHHLANDVYWWGDKIKKQWVYGYRWPVSQSN